MSKRLMGIVILIALIAIAYSPFVLAQDIQTVAPTLLAPDSSTGDISTPPSPSPSAPVGRPVLNVKPFLTPDPEGLRQWKQFLRENPDALPTEPRVTTKAVPQRPLKDLFTPAPSQHLGGLPDEVIPFLTPQSQRAPGVSGFPQSNLDGLPTPPGNSHSAGLQLGPSSALTPAPSQQFEGLSNNDNGPDPDNQPFPPDPQVAVGPNHIVQMVNSVGRITDKTGNNGQTFPLRTAFGVDPEFNEADPRIIYDSISDRWFATQWEYFLNANTRSVQSSIILLVSTDSDPTHPFCAPFRLGDPNNGNYETFAQDFPQLGVSDDKVVITYNGFDYDFDNDRFGPFRGAGLYVINKSHLTSCSANPITSVRRYTPEQLTALIQQDPQGISDWPMFTLQPAQSLGSTQDLHMAQLNYYVTGVYSGIKRAGRIDLVTVRGVPPQEVTLQIATYPDYLGMNISPVYAPPDAHQKDSAVRLDTGDGRLLSAAWQNDSLWVSTNEKCRPDSDPEQRSCLRLIEVKTPTQSGPQPTCPDGHTAPCVNRDIPVEAYGKHLYHPALRPDLNSNLFVVFTSSSESAYAGVWTTSRLASDPPSSPLVINEIKGGGGAQTDIDPALGLGRMGDYSGAALDPSDPYTVWVMGEYIKSPGKRNWGTWVAQLGFLPALVLGLNQSVFQTGETLSLTATVYPSPSPVTADVYIALQLPAGTLLFLKGDGTLTDVQQPYASNWPVSSFSATLFSHYFNGTEPPGSYTWLGAFTMPGTMNYIGSIVSTSFYFSP